MALTSDELRQKLKGLFAFPVTPFNSQGEIDLDRYREHLEYTMASKPDAIFVCGGAGEFFSLNLTEYSALVGAAVEEAKGRIPVIAGCGYGLGLAIDFAHAAEGAGADGLLVLPPYLLQAEQAGLYLHYSAVARATRLGVIIYQRDNAILSPGLARRLMEIPNLAGFKDGHGDMERLGRIRMAVGEGIPLINGMPTAELSALAFFGLGITSYSSAIFNFAPEISHTFYHALTSKNSPQVHQLLDGFFRPFAELRDRQKGYAVSLVKAGVSALHKSVGPARPPLVNPSEKDLEELKRVIEKGLLLVKTM
ncbi:MAG: 5-dehydro-4-deoxyglucarate dehydratase [Terriglobia bacterium]